MIAFFANLWRSILRLFGIKSDPPAPTAPPAAVDTVWALTGTYAGFPVVVRADSRFGGAIYSLTWGGFEFVDSSDHGRELQTAWQLDDMVEGENPTEAGSASDGAGPTSTTVVTGTRLNGNVLETSATLAYWLPYQGTALSPDTLSKRVTLLDGVIHHEVSIDLIGDHRDMAIEGLTGYLPQAFTRFVSFDPASSARAELSPPNGMMQSNLPVLATTADGSYALALWHRDKDKTYAYGRIGPWPKLDAAWFSVPDAKAGRYSFECFTVFGTLASVTATLSRLAQ